MLYLRGIRLRADIAYGGNPQVVPWEAEALWAGETEYQTVNALRACGNPDGAMWDIYPPTPMTGEWLVENGYWDGVTEVKGWYAILLVLVYLGIIQTLHLAKHDQYCKTEAEWINSK